MQETEGQTRARQAVLEALSVAAAAQETCRNAVEMLTMHEPVGDTVMITKRNVDILIDCLRTAADGLEATLNEACRQLETLPPKEETDE